VSGPVDATWGEFGTALRVAWAETTRAANWIATELYARDIRREADDRKLRSMPRLYLYPEARVLFPALSPINLVSLLQSVERTYRRRRYELLWLRAVSVPSYRYPVPAPINEQAWTLTQTDGGQIHARIRLGDRWFTLRLRQGPDFHRQRAQLRSIVAGAALPAAGALYSIRATGDDQTGDKRHTERGQRVLLKLVAWLPRPPQVPAAAGILLVQTSGSVLLVLRMDGQGIVTTIPADHVRRAIAAHEVRRARLATDLAVVRRWKPSERAGLQARLTRITDQHRRAMRTWLQQIAARVVRVAQRQQCGTVRYEDEVRDFQLPMPWQAMRESLKQAVEGHGMIWEYASGETGRETAEALAGGGKDVESS
jgi:hypothetical protein